MIVEQLQQIYTLEVVYALCLLLAFLLFNRNRPQWMLAWLGSKDFDRRGNKDLLAWLRGIKTLHWKYQG